MATNNNNGNDNFRKAVTNFADAFLAMNREERNELTDYTNRRMLEAQREYIESVGRVPAEVIDSTIAQFCNSSNQSNFNELFMYALNGDARCQAQVGQAYRNGWGVKQDNVEAFKWFKKAADQGHAVAQFAVASFYDGGRGLPKNLAEEFKWLKASANQGFAPAQFLVGTYYQRGLVVQQNEAEAMVWYKKAAVQGNALAQDAYGSLLLAKATRTKDKNEAQEAATMLRKSADQGNAHAMCGLGIICEFGIGQKVNKDNAVYWYRKAYDKGDKKAYEHLKRVQGN